MTIKAEFHLGPYDGTIRVLPDNELPKYVWVEETVGDWVRLCRYELQKDNSYSCSILQFGVRSPFAKTYPGGLTMQQLIDRHSR